MNTLTISDVIAQTEAMIKETQATKCDNFVVIYGKYAKVDGAFSLFDPSDLYAMTSKDLNQISSEIHNILPFPSMSQVKIMGYEEAYKYVEAHPYLYDGHGNRYIGVAWSASEYKEALIKHLQSNLQSLLALAN